MTHASDDPSVTTSRPENQEPLSPAPVAADRGTGDSPAPPHGEVPDPDGTGGGHPLSGLHLETGEPTVVPETDGETLD